MMSHNALSQDAEYLAIILRKDEVCRAYKPKFGQGRSVSLDEFRVIYGKDPFYSWFGCALTQALRGL